MRRILLLSMALPLVFAAKASAQSCLGMPSFTSGQMQVAGGGTFTDGANSFGATFGYGPKYRAPSRVRRRVSSTRGKSSCTVIFT